MTAPVRAASQVFTREQVGEVIGLATELERLTGGDTLTYPQLVEVAGELGIAPSAVAEAVGRWQAERRTQARRSVRSLKMQVRRYRRLRRFYRHVATYATVVLGLTLLDWASGPGWWVEWVVFGWGTVVALHGIRILMGKDDPLERILARVHLA